MKRAAMSAGSFGVVDVDIDGRTVVAGRTKHMHEPTMMIEFFDGFSNIVFALACKDIELVRMT